MFHLHIPLNMVHIIHFSTKANRATTQALWLLSFFLWTQNLTMNIKCVLHVFFKQLYKSDLISTKNACEGGERRVILTGHVIYNLGNLVFYHSSCSDKICTYMLNKLVTIEEMSLKNATALSFPANSYKYYLSLSLSLSIFFSLWFTLMCTLIII